LVLAQSTKGNTPLKITERESAMLEEINYVRTKPAEYAEFINEYLITSSAPVSEKMLAKELYKILTTMKPLSSLEFSPYLYNQAVLHGQWMSNMNAFEHSHFNFEYGENLIAGVENVRHAVIDLLVDDGIPGRGHRLNILYPYYKYIAIHEIPKTVDRTDYNFIQMFSIVKMPGK